MRGSAGQLKYLFYSIVIIGVLGTQAVASFGNTDRYFPFLWYPMYAKAHYDGERLDVGHKVYAVTADGTRHQIAAAEDLKIDFWRFERRFARPLVAGQIDNILPFLRLLVAQYPTLISVEAEDYPMVITRNGPVAAPLRTVATLPRGAFEEKL